MNIDANLETFDNDLKKQIVSFKKRRKRNRSIAGSVVLFGAVFSAITTILVGASSIFKGFSSYLGLFALITSSSTTVLQSWDGLFGHKRLWIQYTDTLTRLYELENDLRHIKANSKTEDIPIAQNVLNTLYYRYKDILRDSNSGWLSIRANETNNASSTIHKEKKNNV